ncbi:MAG TPA: hypothetical protein VMS60_11740 [Solirubrobacterales bacterium]|nr:hypothetical protein [Solirubrobacterales bacterium]
MQPPRYIAPPLVAALLLASCGGAESPPTASPLLRGGKGAPVTASLVPAARLARRFAVAYARSAYQRRPPRLPGATAALTRRFGLAAAKVPPSRRHLRPRATAVGLELAGATTLRGNVEVSDGRSRPFSVGFTLRKRAWGWRVISASPPG